MGSNKNNINKKDNTDLNFAPLNIDSSFSHNGVKFPLLFNMDCSVSLGLPNLTFTCAPSQVSPIIPAVPLTPYPDNIPDLDYKTSISANDTGDNISLEYPDETNEDTLYSYNESRINDEYLNDSINHLDILRNFDLTIDFTSTSRKDDITEDDVNEIFDILESNNPGVFATLKAYRVPYPITKLLVKKIIKTTLENTKR